MILLTVVALCLAWGAAHAALTVPLRRGMRRSGGSWPLTAGLALTWAVGGAAIWAAFAYTQADLERNTPALWGSVCGLSTLMGLGAARRSRRLPALELGIAASLVFEVAAVLVIWSASATHAGLTAAPLRALLVAPAALGLCSYFGASVGYLLWGSGRVDLRLGYESLVGRRFLLSRASPVLSTVTTISVVGVSLGVWLVLVSLGILAGFETDLQGKIIGANAHLVLQPGAESSFALTPELADNVSRAPGVLALAPYVEGEVAIASYSNYSGAQLFGVDPERSPHVISVLNQLESGSLEPLLHEMRGDADEADEAPAADVNAKGGFAPPAKLASIVIGTEMAKGLNVKVGDKVRMISPMLEVLTPLGVAPKSLGFRVAAIFSTKMYEYDARFAYVALPAARRFLEMGPTHVSGLQLKCDDPESSDRIGAKILKQLPADAPQLEALDWKRRNQTLFSALKLERVVAFVVLVFIILVASFSIVNTLTMSVIEKQREIAILKTMGAHDVGIMKLFLVQGLLVGAFGTGIGATAGVTTMKLLERFGFWIPGDVYYIDSLPVHLESADVLLVVLAALLIVWDFAVFPALRGSQLQPVEGLRDG